MPPRTTEGPQSGATAEDAATTGGVDNTGPDTRTAAEIAATGDVPTPTREAERTGGAKLIRVTHPGDRYVYDRKANDGDATKGVITGDYQEFPATKAKEVIESARVAGVRLLVADKGSKES